MTSRKIIVLSVITIIIIVLIGSFFLLDINIFSYKQDDVLDNYFNKMMEIKEVSRGNLTNSISSKGLITIQAVTNVTTPENITTKEIKVLPGSRIEIGDILVTIDEQALQDDYDNLQNIIKENRLQLGKMKPEYDYIKILATQGGTIIENNIKKGKKISEILEDNENLLVIETDNGSLEYGTNLPEGTINEVYDDIKKNKSVKTGQLLFVIKVLNNSFENKVNEIAELEKQLKNIEELLYDPTIKSNVAGIVEDVIVGDDFTCQKDEILLRIKQIDDFLIKISITKDELIKIDKNNDVTVTLNSCDKIAGEIYHINYNAKDDEKFDVLIKLADIDNINPNDMLPGLSVDVNIILEERKDVLKVPINAIKTDDNGEYVFVYTGKKEDFSSYNIENIPVEKRYIEKGMVTSMYAQIISGVEKGEHVVIVNTGTKDNSFFEGLY